MPFLSRLAFFVCFTSSCFVCLAQNKLYTDSTFDKQIRSVQLNPTGALTLNPLIQLGNELALQLEFDDLEGDYYDYFYTVIHCDANWEPSALNEFEYLDSYTEGLVRDFEYSYQTNTAYTHYSLTIPNQDVSWTKSGNYVLWVYRKVEGEKEIILSRRFCVFENIMNISAQVNRANSSALRNTHQEVLFQVLHEDVVIRNPQVELTGTIVQNWNWHSAVYDLHPLFSRQETQDFSNRGLSVFPGLKEFRPIDLRNLNYVNQQVLGGVVENIDGLFRVASLLDQSRGNSSHTNYRDLNGRFVIENRDYPNLDPSTGADYAEVLFELKTDVEYKDREVHWLGAANNWGINERSKMVYNPVTQTYVGKQNLKMGYYDYLYGLVDPKTKEISFSELEGNSFETENDYTILVYYRPFGQRYDRLVAVEVTNQTF